MPLVATSPVLTFRSYVEDVRTLVLKQDATLLAILDRLRKFEDVCSQDTKTLKERKAGDRAA